MEILTDIRSSIGQMLESANRDIASKTEKIKKVKITIIEYTMVDESKTENIEYQVRTEPSYSSRYKHILREDEKKPFRESEEFTASPVSQVDANIDEEMAFQIIGKSIKEANLRIITMTSKLERALQEIATMKREAVHA